MAKEKEIIKAVELVVGLLKNKGKLIKDIDALTLKIGDVQLDLAKEKRKAKRELEKHTEEVKIESNALTTKLNCLKGELKRLLGEIASKKESIANFDLTIDGLKQQNAELETSNKKLKEINDGIRAEAKKFSNKLAEV